jgi:serine/threonine protein phosphatase PrpC
VEKHISTYPLSAADLDNLEHKEGTAARKLIEANPAIVYGSTLVAVLATGSFLFLLQVGDGDALVVYDDGNVNRPIPPDPRLFGNETTSLSSPKAANDLRFAFQRFTGSPPRLVLLSTDGYANSFCSDQDFLKVGSDIVEILNADGIDSVTRDLESWLTDASRLGSGDDITAGIIIRGEEPYRERSAWRTISSIATSVAERLRPKPTE